MVALAHLFADEALDLVPVVDLRRADTVRWVATSEITDPAPYLEGGEVLLTTGLEMAGWAAEWMDYVSRLATARVVAIGFGIGFTHSFIPAALIDACRAHSIDLFEVPRDTRFVAISLSVADALNSESQLATRDALAAQRALARAAIDDAGTSALVAETAAMCLMAAVVTSDGFVIEGPYGERPEIFDGEVVRDALVPMRPRGLRAAANISTGSATVLIQPLGVQGRPSHYLVVAYAARLTEVQRGSLATAVTLLSLAEEQRRIGRDADRRLRVRAIETAIAGDERTARLLLDLGSKPRIRLPRKAVVVRAAGDAAAIDDALGALESKSLAGVVAGQLVVVAQRDRADLIATAAAQFGLRVGIGEAGTSSDLRMSYETAGHALELTSPESLVASWADNVRRGVLSMVDTARASAFAATILQPVEAEDHALIETLAAYLRNNGSLLRVAEELSVHRNTARNRVERIEEILQRSLLDPQVRVDTWVALQAWGRSRIT